MPPFDPASTGARVTLRVQPRAGRTKVAGLDGDAVRIRLAAPPVGGVANEALVRLFADRLGLWLPCHPPRRG